LLYVNSYSLFSLPLYVDSRLENYFIKLSTTTKLDKSIKTEPGDLVYFKEKFENNHGITKIISGDLFLSEAWMGKRGQHWMENKASYEEVDWENWEIKGFYE
jgi:hypothetical protein